MTIANTTTTRHIPTTDRTLTKYARDGDIPQEHI